MPSTTNESTVMDLLLIAFGEADEDLPFNRVMLGLQLLQGFSDIQFQDAEAVGILGFLACDLDELQLVQQLILDTKVEPSPSPFVIGTAGPFPLRAETSPLLTNRIAVAGHCISGL
jgi:hypothetical protein